MENQFITEKEKIVLQHLVDAHNEYIKLEQQHPNDIYDWVNSLHRLQDLIAIRVARKAEPTVFVTIKTSSEINTEMVNKVKPFEEKFV